MKKINSYSISQTMLSEQITPQVSQRDTTKVYFPFTPGAQ